MMIKEANDAKKVFREQGTCSKTFFYLFDREFAQKKEIEERASDSLAGGIMQRGYQCGMLWGSALAIGAEAYRRCDDLDQAMRVAMRATQAVMISFAEKESTINCRDITRCDFSNRWSFAKYFLSGRFLHCFRLAEQWAPEAIETAMEALDVQGSNVGSKATNGRTSDSCHLNCASLVAKSMGATDEEMVMVAGFAGGLGLSGGGCGALSAAIWMRSLDWCRENPDKSSFKNPKAVEALKEFEQNNRGEMRCSELTGRFFQTLQDHHNFIADGGCGDRIRELARTV